MSVVRRKGDAIDWDYLERWVGEFAAVPGREDMTVSLTRLRDES